jgi:hypothetical protein
LQPIDDGFPAPPDAGKQIDDAWFNAILGSISPPLRAVHPERLWIPLVDAFAAGLYFFGTGRMKSFAFPALLRCGFPKTACIAKMALQYCGRPANDFSLYMVWKLLQRTPGE